VQTTHRTDVPVEIELEQFEGELLCSFVEELIIELSDDRNVETLEYTCEQLGEANAVALWSRERVRLDLAVDDTIQLLDALVVSLEEHELPLEEEQILSRVRERMMEELICRHTALVVGDKAPDRTATCVVS
jgi:hypothetical protein